MVLRPGRSLVHHLLHDGTLHCLLSRIEVRLEVFWTLAYWTTKVDPTLIHLLCSSLQRQTHVQPGTVRLLESVSVLSAAHQLHNVPMSVLVQEGEVQVIDICISRSM